METKRAAPEKIVFRGTADQLEQAGDYALILSYLHSRRTGQMLGPLVALFLVCAALLQYQRGDLAWTAVYAILAVLVGAAVMRKTTGEEPVQAVAEDRRSRETAQARGSYDGDLPFRIELDRGECRVYFQEEGGDKLYQLFDCRKFRTAIECDEIVWITGKKRSGLPLPKAQLVDASPEDLRRWLRPYAAVWLRYKIPDKLKEAVTGQEVAD